MPVEGTFLQIGQRPGAIDPCIIDQNIQTPVFSPYLSENSCHTSFVRDIAFDNYGLTSGLLNLANNTLRRNQIPRIIDKDDKSFFREFLRNFSTNAFGRACYKRNFLIGHPRTPVFDHNSINR